MSEILYMKIERNSRVTHADVRLGDVAGLEGVNRSVTARLNAIRYFGAEIGNSGNRKSGSTVCIDIHRFRILYYGI